MRLQTGDYIIWNGNATRTGEFSIARLSASGGLLERVPGSGGDDKMYSHLLKSENDFQRLVILIAETHNMYARPVNADEKRSFTTLRIHPAWCFVSLDT
jgi:hypothetical protein